MTSLLLLIWEKAHNPVHCSNGPELASIYQGSKDSVLVSPGWISLTLLHTGQMFLCNEPFKVKCMHLLKMAYVHSRSEQHVSQTTVVLILFKMWITIYQDTSAYILCIVLSLGFPSLDQSAQENQLLKRQVYWGSQFWSIRDPFL